MNKLLIIVICLLGGNYSFGQSTFANNQWTAPRFLGYNGSNGINPLFFRTNDLNRMKINGNLSYAVNGYNATRNGNVLIGASNNTLNSNLNMYTGAMGAYSLLHLNGEGPVAQEYGYRPWMDAGLTMTGNSDFAYFGLRKVGTIVDHSETVIMWADNGAGNETYGPDNMVFRFSGFGGTDGSTVSSNRISSTDLDGLHIATFNPSGYFGLGNTFGLNSTGMTAANYVRPQSLMHMSYDWRSGTNNLPYGFMQITYRKPDAQGSNYIGQGEAATDGLRIGIDNTIYGVSTPQNHLNAYLRWQEASSFIIQTEDDLSPSIDKAERVRITSIGALKANYTSTEYLGNTGPSNSTRVSISADGNIPVKKPMSLLHLGNDLDAFGPASTADGWRNWMDIGTFTTNGADHMYVGLKSEDASTGERMDAVVNWGDDQQANGPDNLRFIFTSPLGPSSPTSGAQANGLEGMRLTPSDNNGIYTGIGGSTGNLYFGGSQNPTSTLEVNSWGATSVAGGSSGLRFTNLNTSSPTIFNPGLGVLSVNSSGEVIYVQADAGSAGGFVDCANNGPASNLTTDSKVSLNNNNLYFATNDIEGKNHIGVGYNCTPVLPAKMSVIQSHPLSVNSSTTAISGINIDKSNDFYHTHIGVHGKASGEQINVRRHSNIGGVFEGTGADFNIGIRARGYSSTSDPSAQTMCWGGKFSADGYKYNVGIETIAQYGTHYNVGISAVAKTGNIWPSPIPLFTRAGEFLSFESLKPTGVYAKVFADLHNNTIGNAIYATYENTGTTGSILRSGYFTGVMQATSTFVSLSDQMFKTDVTPINSALNILSQVKPQTYYMDTIGFPQMNFTSEMKYGFIAQEVENTLPGLVYPSVHPADYDSMGNVIHPEISYKALNYNAFIPINTAAIQELDREFQNRTLSDQSIKSNVVDLNSSLTKVLAMRGVSYDWTSNAQTTYSLDSTNHVGFIAQEIQQVDSRLTFIGRDSLLHVEYEKIVPILAEAIQELNKEVEEKDSIINAINSRLTTLENCLSGILPFLCQLSQSAIQANTPETQTAIRTQLEVKLNNKESIILDQNVPNPFAEQTVINYSIPESVQKAQIHFYNTEGRIIQSVEISERGLGSLTVFGSDLSRGIYTYSLVADGKVVSTKKMMKD